MKLTQRLIIILGDTSLITNDGILKCIAGFKAVTIIKTLTEEMLNTVYHYNKNAVYFSTKFAMDWMQVDETPLAPRETALETGTTRGSASSLASSTRRSTLGPTRSATSATTTISPRWTAMK